MAVYKCSVCGYIYDESREEKPFLEIQACPACRQSAKNFLLIEEAEKDFDELEKKENVQGMDLSYDKAYARKDPSSRYMPYKFTKWQLQEGLLGVLWEQKCLCPIGTISSF